MSWREAAGPVRMQRVALVAPRSALRELLVGLAAAGTVELETTTSSDRPAPVAGGARVEALLSPTPPDLAELERTGRTDLMAGEAELARHAQAAVLRDDVAALAAWTPVAAVPELSERLAPLGAGVVAIPAPRGVDPPTKLRGGHAVRESFGPLVETYGTVPYADVDPSTMAAGAYMLMFGMMFGDAGHGALLVVAGILLRAGRPQRLASLHRVWPFVVGSGLAATSFGLLYGEFFGPTGVIPVLWLSPLDAPVTLLVAALAVGAGLLAMAQVVGTVNRWREGGLPLALVAPSGIAGAALLAGLGVTALAVTAGSPWLTVTGLLTIAGGIVLGFLGFLATSGGGGTGVAQAVVETFDTVLRAGTNLISFTRLAAFGLTHAALGQIVWEATSGLVQSGGLLVLAAVAVFVLGNTLAFALEGLVAGVQALRLEYYELFSRIFGHEGRAFRPWHLPIDHPDRPAMDGADSLTTRRP